MVLYVSLLHGIVCFVYWKLTPEEEKKFLDFKNNELPQMMKLEDTLLDYLNYQVKFLKGKDILTYYTPCDPSKDKEPFLNRELSDKWQPPKTVAQKDRLKEESKTIAMKMLAKGPDERNRRRKKGKKT